ncbi:MAG TPA: hypothetical protein GX707_10185 [Epulopiscium sp.]|nr:hypothetical protein [Candidatus Epulonipiscium sp.]
MFNGKINITKLLVLCIIPFSVFVDLMNGFIQLVLNKNFPIGEIYRGGLFMLLFMASFIEAKKTDLFNIFALVVFVLLNALWLFNSDFYSLSKEFGYFVRLYYPYLILIFYIKKFDYLDKDFLLKCIVSFGFIAGSTIIFSYVTGLGVDSYGDYTFGVKSFFKAQNDIGLSLILTLVPALYYLLSTRKMKYLVSSIVITVGSIFLGTRAGIGGSILVWVTMFMGLLLFRFRSSHIPTRLRVFILIIGGVVVSIAGHFAYTIVSSSDYMMRKFTLDALSGGNARESLVRAGFKALESRNIFSDLFGEGHLSFHSRVNYNINFNYQLTRIVEVDFVDLIGVYGYIIGIGIISIPVIFLFISMHNFSKALSLYNYSLIIAILIFCGHSFYAGHAMISPTVATFYSAYMFLILKQKSKKNVKHSID